MIVPAETPKVDGKVVLASNVERDPDHVQVKIAESVGEMERRSDGAFVYRLDEPGDTVVYSVTGASVDGRPLPGNGQIRLVARDRSRPFYETVLENPPRPLEIVYDPALLPKAEPGAESHMKTSNATLEKVLAILRERSRGAATSPSTRQE